MLSRVLPAAFAVATRVGRAPLSRAFRAGGVSASASAISRRLTLLRAEMEQSGVHALVVPSGEPHLSEYVVHPCYERRAFVSGFNRFGRHGLRYD